MPPIALLTDFGLSDTYVGVMKGVISELSPDAQVIDVTHAIPQGDIRLAAFKLWQAVDYFPDGTVFVVVVDPGVGTSRKPVAVTWRSLQIIAPDNGVLTYLLCLEPAKSAVVLENEVYQLDLVSTTFHGRDIFAPAGAHIWNGVELERLGRPLADLMQFRPPSLEPGDRSIRGEILHADRFGNLITSIGRLSASTSGYQFQPWYSQSPAGNFPAGTARATLPDGTSLDLQTTFGDVPPGDPVAYIGSEGLVEIAVNGGSALVELGFGSGDPVELRFEGHDG